MSENYDLPMTEERLARRKARAEARRRRERERRRKRMRILIPCGAALVLLLVLLIIFGNRKAEPPKVQDLTPEKPVIEAEPLVTIEEKRFTPKRISSTETPDAEAINSEYCVLVDSKDGTILAGKQESAKIYPASMTKIMTILVAAENAKNLDDTFTIHIGITDRCFSDGLSVVGYALGEEVKVRELFYGTILPSGADAAIALAEYVAGSEEAFVSLMNKKVEELGIGKTTHFMNCAGDFHEEHYTTANDMAIILRAAMENEFCREVLGTKKYTTEQNEEHPDGILLSNWFLRRIEDKETGKIDVIGAKTGYVVAAKSCAASCGTTADGHEYLCVTAFAGSSWQAIYDHVTLYSTYVK